MGWFYWYKKKVKEKYGDECNFSEDNIIRWIEYPTNDLMASYIGRSWFIRDNVMYIEVYDEEGKVTFVSENNIIELNWCLK